MNRCPVVAVLVLAFVAGCTGSRQAELPPDERYGHRYTVYGAPDDRPVVSIMPADRQEYFFYPAYIDSIHIRQGAFEPHIETEIQRVAVEVLVKGVYPDDCSDLAILDQHRYGHIIEVDLMMRKQQDSVCTRVRRPYRFYFTLEGSYRAGHYTLKLNGSTHPFSVRPRRS